VLLCILLSTTTRQGYAQVTLPTDTTSTYVGIDVLLLIDQSGSMRGYANCLSGPTALPATDPEKLRFELAKEVANWLSAFRFSASPETPVRLAVIYFGDAASPNGTPTLLRMDWTEVGNFAPGQLASQQKQIADIQQLLSAESYGNRDMCNTDFLSAFDHAQDMFDGLDPNPTGPTLRSIIVVTDGAPCAPWRQPWRNTEVLPNRGCGDLGNEETHLRTLQSNVNSVFPSPSYRTYLLALDANNQFWSRNQGLWEAITTPDNATKVDQAEQLTLSVIQILRDLTSQLNTNLIQLPVISLREGRAPFEVPPFLSLMRINIFRMGKDLQDSPAIRFRTPDGGLLQEGSGVTIIGRNLRVETWQIISSPSGPVAPGTWYVETADGIGRDDVEVLVDQAYIVNELVGLNEQEYYEWVKVPIEASLKLRGENSIEFQLDLAQYPNHKLDVMAYLGYPGRAAPIEQALTPSGLPEPQFSVSFIPPAAGLYHIGLCGFAQTTSGTPVKRLEGLDDTPCNAYNDAFAPLDTLAKPSRIVVQEIRKDFRLDERFAISSSWYAGVEGKFYLDLTNTRGERLTTFPEELQFYGILTDSSGSSTRTPVMTLLVDPAAPATYSGTFTAPQAGRHCLQVVGELDEREIYRSNDWCIDIQPIIPLAVRILQPEGAVDVDWFAPLFSITQTPLNVAVIRTDTNELFDTSRFTSQPITGYVIETTQPLTLTGNTSNFTGTFEAGLGSYNLQFAGPALDTMSCGCSYLSNGQIAQALIRVNFPGWVFVAAIIAVIVLLVIWTIWRIWSKNSQAIQAHPMVGVVEFYKLPAGSASLDNAISLGKIDLTQKKRNRVAMSNHPLKYTGIRQITLYNNGIEEWSNSGRVIIEYRAPKSDRVFKTTISPDSSDDDRSTWIPLTMPTSIADAGHVYYAIITNTPADDQN
jgi:hypothetical protein